MVVLYDKVFKMVWDYPFQTASAKCLPVEGKSHGKAGEIHSTLSTYIGHLDTKIGTQKISIQPS